MRKLETMMVSLSVRCAKIREIFPEFESCFYHVFLLLLFNLQDRRLETTYRTKIKLVHRTPTLHFLLTQYLHYIYLHYLLLPLPYTYTNYITACLFMCVVIR